MKKACALGDNDRPLSHTIYWLRVLIGIGAAAEQERKIARMMRGEAGDEMNGAVPNGFGHGTDEQDHGAVRRKGNTGVNREISRGRNAGG